MIYKCSAAPAGLDAPVDKPEPRNLEPPVSHMESPAGCRILHDHVSCNAHRTKRQFACRHLSMQPSTGRREDVVTEGILFNAHLNAIWL